MDTKENTSAFDYFQDSERLEEIQKELSNVSVLDLILDAREGSHDSLLLLIKKAFSPIKHGFHLNQQFNGNQDLFLNRFLKSLIVKTKKKEGPLWTVDILDGNDSDQLEQLGIEFYTYSKKLSAVGDETEQEIFPEEQEVHPLMENKGLFTYLSKVKPEYAQILSYMVHYTPSDEIVKEMELEGLNSLSNKIKALRVLVDRYFEKEDRRDDAYQLAK